MSLIKFFSSRIFLKQLIIAFIIVFLVMFLFLKWLNITTNHGQEIMVPDLRELSIAESEKILERLDLNYVVSDSVDYLPRFAVGAVVEQEPTAGEKVKEGRKIYIKINASGYEKVRLPNLVQKTYRQVLPTLRGLGLDQDTVIYMPNIAKDMVLELRYRGRVLNPGDMIPKASKIDLILGDGSIQYKQIDTIKIINGK